jgi:hypothetical protein
MTRTSKILATVGIVLVFLLINGLLQAGSGPGGRNLGVVGIILFFGLIAALRSVWRKSDPPYMEDTHLDKR